MKGKTWLVGCLGLIVLLGIAGGVALWFLVPSMDTQLPPVMQSAIVTITTPVNGSAVPMNALTSVQADAIGGVPVVTLELWIDGIPAQSKSNSDKSNPFSASWTWSPQSEGEHMLMVRAVGSDQRVTTSNVVRLVSSKAANNVINVEYTPKPGQTLPDVAGQFKVTPQEIVDVNPGLDPNKPLPSGQPIEVPVDVPFVPSTGGDSTGQPPAGGTETPADDGSQPPSGNEPTIDFPNIKLPKKNCVLFPWLCNLGFGNFDAAPKMPKVGAQVKTCDVKLVIDDRSDNEMGFYVYRSDPISHDFQRVATLDAHSGTGMFGYVDQHVYGKLMYYVASFNKWGESPSKYVKVEVHGQACATSDWTAVGADKGELIITEQVDKVYCYLSVNKGPWKRIPANPNGFFKPENGKIDIKQYLAALAPSNPQGTVVLTLQCWGWKGNTLVYLGETEMVLKEGQQTGNLGGNNKVIIIPNLVVTRTMLIPNLPSNPGLPLNIEIAKPYDLAVTQDANECRAHFGNVNQINFCDQWVGLDTYQVLVWKHNAAACGDVNECGPDTHYGVDGYKLYRLPADYLDPPELVATIPYQKTIFLIKKQEVPEGMNFVIPDQYVVTAYKGAFESEYSNTTAQENYTPPPPPPTEKSFSLNPTKLGFSRMDKGGVSTPSHYSPTNWPQVPQGQTLTGFFGSGGSYSSAYYRGGMLFDVTQVTGEIQKAKLYLPVRGGKYKPTGESVTNIIPSCATSIMLATEKWWETGYMSMYPGVDFIPLGIVNSADLPSGTTVVDITETVKKWKKGTLANYGFVLRGSIESMDALTSNDIECTTFYGDMFLKVTTIE